jgi:hypothetical protein
MSRLIQAFLPSKKEDATKFYNEVAFKILDLDRDRALNILNLLHLQMNLSPSTKIG